MEATQEEQQATLDPALINVRNPTEQVWHEDTRTLSLTMWHCGGWANDKDVLLLRNLVKDKNNELIGSWPQEEPVS